MALSLSPCSSSTTTCTAALRTSASGSILAMAVKQEVTCGDGIVSRGHEGIPQSSCPQGKDEDRTPTPHPGQLRTPCLPLAPQIGFLWVMEQPSLSQGLSDTQTPWNAL